MKFAHKLAEIAKANQQPSKEDIYGKFLKKAQWESHQYVRYILKSCKKLATQGYGSVTIGIDRTTELFEKDEGRNSAYIASFVEKLLLEHGFSLNEPDDCYDAIYYLLTWDETLPISPERLGLSWK